MTDGYYLVRVRDPKGKAIGFLTSNGNVNKLRVHAARVEPDNLDKVLADFLNEYKGEGVFIKYKDPAPAKN